MLNRLIYWLVRLLHVTYRYEFHGRDNIREAADRSESGTYLFGIWHQNVLAGITAQMGNPHVVIVSKSRDAEPVAYTCTRLGHLCCRGSSRKGEVSKGGREAKDEMIEALKRGMPGAISVDGPNGPVFVPKRGIVDAARKSGAAIVPYSCIPGRYVSFNSWDRFRLPIPFTRICVVYGKPIRVDPAGPGDEFQYYMDALKASLDKDEEWAKRLLSR